MAGNPSALKIRGEYVALDPHWPGLSGAIDIQVDPDGVVNVARRLDRYSLGEHQAWSALSGRMALGSRGLHEAGWSATGYGLIQLLDAASELESTIREVAVSNTGQAAARLRKTADIHQDAEHATETAVDQAGGALDEAPKVDRTPTSSERW